MTVPNEAKSIEDSFVTTAPVAYLNNSYLVTEGPKSWVVAFVKTDDSHFYLNRISGADGLPTPKQYMKNPGSLKVSRGFSCIVTLIDLC